MFFNLLPPSGLVCAHRGARSIAPENTIYAFEKAHQCGAHFLELDIHQLADGELVVFHDKTLERTTDVHSRAAFSARAPWNIHEFHLAEVRCLDAGSWFVQDDPFESIAKGHVTQHESEMMQELVVPTLAEVLEFCCARNFPVNVEIKDQAHAPQGPSIVPCLLDVLKKADAAHLVLVSSFNHDYLRELKTLEPSIAVAALADEHPQDLGRYLLDLGAAAYHPLESIMDASVVHQLADVDISVTPFTVNDVDRAKELLAMGCYAITTDFPQLLQNL